MICTDRQLTIDACHRCVKIPGEKKQSSCAEYAILEPVVHMPTREASSWQLRTHAMSRLHPCYQQLLLALLNKLKLLVQIIPLIVLCRLRLSRPHIILSRNPKFLLRLARRNIALKLLETRLIDRKPVRVNPTSNEIDPPLIPLRQNMLGNITRVLIRIPDNRDNTVTTRNFVVLEPRVKRLCDARAVLLNVRDSIDERRDRIIDIND